MEGSRKVHGTGFYDVSIGRVIVQEREPEETQGSWPTTTMMMGRGRNNVPFTSGKFIPSSRGNNGGVEVLNDVVGGGNPLMLLFPVQGQEHSILIPVNELLSLARTLKGARSLMNHIKKEDPSEIQVILEVVLRSMFEWMIDNYAHIVFIMLVGKCQNTQLQLIVNKAISEPDRFAEVAFTSNGSKSMQKIIKCIKNNTSMELSITRALIPKSYEMLTHKEAADVVILCFLTFEEMSTIIFLQKLSERESLLDLARDKVGYISLCRLLDSNEVWRKLTLDHLSNDSLLLANDPYGNFIVQYLLKLKKPMVTEIIVNHLKENFEVLALTQCGSHVVEVCMRSSETGLRVVISEITKKGNTLFQIAEDNFGNYVIQTALEVSKMLPDKNLYMQLIDALKPYYSSLSKKIMGRHVAKMIKDDIESEEIPNDE